GRSRLVCRGRACSDAAFSASGVRSLSWVFRIDLPSTAIKVGAAAECSTVGGSSVVEHLVNFISRRCRCHGAWASVMTNIQQWPGEATLAETAKLSTVVPMLCDQWDALMLLYPSSAFRERTQRSLSAA